MGRHEEVEGVLEQLAGPLTWSDADHATGTYRGAPIGLEKWYSSGGASVRQLGGVTFTCDLGGRPINLFVELKQARGPGPIDISTGFAEKFTVKGWPTEAVEAALDQSVQRVIADGFDGRFPTIETKDGKLRYARRVLLLKPERTATPDELEPFLAAVQSMGAALVESFDATLDEIHRSRGEAAAQAWYDEQRSNQTRHAAKRAGGRVLALVVAAIVAVGFGAALAAGWL
jgi:hypothetical protein